MYDTRPIDFAGFKYIALCSKTQSSFGFDRILGAHTKDELYKLIAKEEDYNYFIITEVQEEHLFSTTYKRETVSIRRL